MPRKPLELIGKKYNRLKVLKETGIKVMPNGKKIRVFLCVCDCGNKKEIYGEFIKSGHTKSCGCLGKEKLIKRSTKHGMSPRNKYYKFYWVWASIIQRCTNKNNKESWLKYGRKGIKVCDKWLSFINFKKDMLKEYNKHVKEFGEKNTQIDRINFKGNYCKENCRWVTIMKQARNRSNNHLVVYNNKKYTISELAEKYNINYGTLLSRINRSKMSIKKAINLPIKNVRKKISRISN